jgi:hypothetical protein
MTSSVDKSKGGSDLADRNSLIKMKFDQHEKEKKMKEISHENDFYHKSTTIFLTLLKFKQHQIKLF